MASPDWKIYDAQRKYIGCMKSVEDAAIIVAAHGSGQIRLGHSLVVWNEGKESQSAAESYDFVRLTARQRINAYYRKKNPDLYKKVYG